MSKGSGRTIAPRIRISRAATRAQDGGVQIGSICPALPQHACRRPQQLQPSTSSRLAIHAPDLPSRGGEPMARCSRGSVIAHPAPGSLCLTRVNLTMPLVIDLRPFWSARRSDSLSRRLPLLSVSWFALALIATGDRRAAWRSPRRRNRPRRRGKRSARRGGNWASRELLDQDGDARSEYEATEGSQPRSRSALPASGHELPEVSGVQSHGLYS